MIDLVGELRRIMNLSAAETYDPATDSLEAIRDFLALTTPLAYGGTVTAVPGANQFTIPTLAGLGAGKFVDAVAPWWALVFRDAGGAGAAPQGEMQAITAYVTATGAFTTAAFTAAVAVDDEILLLNPLLAAIGRRIDAATLDDMSALATASLIAEVKRVLLRMSPDAFTATIQGAARAELDTMLAQLATYISALGAAYSAAVNPGAIAKTNIEQTLEDLGDVLAGAGITIYPAGAAAADGISIAEVMRYIQETVLSPTVMGRSQIKATTIDLNQAAGTYDLFTATTQDVVIEKLVIRMSGGAVGGAVTSISIQTDDATPQVIIPAAVGAVAKLTNEAQPAWIGERPLDAGTSAKIQLTIAGGAAGVARVCDVAATYRAIVSGGILL